MANPVTIELGARNFPLSGLSLKQVRAVTPKIVEMITAASQTDEVALDLMLDIVATGLSRAYPDVTRDTLLELDGDYPALLRAASKIGQLAGLLPGDDEAKVDQPKSAEPGEAQPAADGAGVS